MSEYVLPCTYCGKCLGAGGNLATGLAARGLDHRRLRTAQEGIGPLLQGQRGGQGDLTIPAQVFHYLQTYADVRVVRFHRLGKAQVGLGVFMGAIYGGGVRQGSQALERVVHLRRGACEDAYAATAEQGGATEQPGRLRVIAEEGSMIQGVTGHCDDAKALAGEVDLTTVGECRVDTVEGRVVRPENPALGGGLE